MKFSFESGVARLALFGSYREGKALALVLALAGTGLADVESFNFISNTDVPDGTSVGLADTRFISSSLTSLTDVNVSIDLSGTGFGGWNGDLYLTLVHGSGFSVLLNRPGRTTSALSGYSDQGMSITFDDGAAQNIHSYRQFVPPGSDTTPLASTLTGSWRPDGRATDPGAVLNTDPVTENLSSFNGESGSGQWVLFIADLESGATTRLNNWTLQLTGLAPVPEASTGIAIGALVLGLAGFAWRRGNRS